MSTSYMEPAGAGTSGVDQRYYGKYRGTVTDNADPQQIGRIKASVPAVFGDEETGWALPALPYAGAGSGFYTIPEPGAGVWIEFEGGDVSHPIWTGCFWGSGGLPADEAGTAATPDLKILRTEEGLLAALDDNGKSIVISDGNGTNLLKITTQDGKIRLQAQMKVIVEAPQIELVDGAAHPLVFGDNLLQYLNQLVSMFNAHLHPGQLAAGMLPVTPAPPVPSFPPPTPSLLSMKVKTG